MPNFDRTGPNGEGPNTGRGMGPCDIEKAETPPQRPSTIQRKRRRSGVPFGRQNRKRRRRG